MSTPRNTHGVAVLDGRLFAVGGYENGELGSVERYDPASDRWQRVAELGTSRMHFGLVAY